MNVLCRSISTTVCCVNEIMNERIHLAACMLMNNATKYVLLFRLDDYNMYHVCRVCQ